MHHRSRLEPHLTSSGNLVPESALQLYDGSIATPSVSIDPQRILPETQYAWANRQLNICPRQYPPRVPHALRHTMYQRDSKPSGPFSNGNPNHGEEGCLDSNLDGANETRHAVGLRETIKWRKKLPASMDTVARSTPTGCGPIL